MIRRCLDSVLPFIDCWLIVDTGSTDGTQDIVREHLWHVPGQLIERPWVDFAHNRTEALLAARRAADYVLVIDADETLEHDPFFVMPKLDLDAYNLEVHYGGYTYLRKAITTTRLDWRYEGVLHEYVCCDTTYSEGFVAGLRTIPHTDGARARNPDTYRYDALTLERALIAEPSNSRYVFYLAQSYRDAGDYELALRHYRRRVEMGGWREEMWYAMYQIAQILERIQKPWSEVIHAYLAAYEFNPDRAGPLYRIAMHYQFKGEYYTSHLFLSRAVAIPMPRVDSLFVETTIYSLLAPVEHAVACFYVGDHRTAIATNNALLARPDLPPSMIAHVTRNRRFSLDALFPPAATASPLPAPRTVYVCAPVPSRPDLADDIIESVARQLDVEAHLHFVGPVASPLRLPEESSFSHDVRSDSFSLGLRRYASGLPDDAIIAILPKDSKLDTCEALRHISACFANPGCDLAHGQYRHSDGIIGDAAPAADHADHLLITSRKHPVAVAVKVRLIKSFVEDLTEESEVAASLLKPAGFSGTRFVDEPITRKLATAIPLAAPPRHGAALPRISCLMVTYDRLGLAKRSMDCFARQTYPNRELVIVTNGIPAFVASLSDHAFMLGIDVRFVTLPEHDLTLGCLRNISLDAAQGDIVCQWDDDDCNHPERLERQTELMTRENAHASLMTDHLQFLEDAGLVMWVDWTLGRGEGVDQLLPGTLMMHRDRRFRYPEVGPYASRGEDTMFLNQLYAVVPVASLVGYGYLYLYTYHGRNTFSKDHHHNLSTFSRTADAMLAEARQIREALSHYPIPRPVAVVGRDGPAFVV